MKKIIYMIFSALIIVSFIGCGVESMVTSEETAKEEQAPGLAVMETDDDRTYRLTDTGQKVSSYDADGNEISPSEGEAFYGQDADYQGTEASFTDNGDGTVTDNVTGLMWQQVPVSETFSWEEAQEYCESLELGGYDDWRAPTVKELFAIGDFETGWPFLDTDYFEFPEASAMPEGMEGGPQGSSEDGEETEMPPPENGEGDSDSVGKDQGQFWTSNFYYVGTTHGGAPTAFGVNHATGHIKGYPSDAGGNMGKHVRAVRGEVTAENNFVDNGDGTVSDLATGLMWRVDDNSEGVEW